MTKNQTAVRLIVIYLTQPFSEQRCGSFSSFLRLAFRNVSKKVAKKCLLSWSF